MSSLPQSPEATMILNTNGMKVAFKASDVELLGKLPILEPLLNRDADKERAICSLSFYFTNSFKGPSGVLKFRKLRFQSHETKGGRTQSNIGILKMAHVLSNSSFSNTPLQMTLLDTTKVFTVSMKNPFSVQVLVAWHGSYQMEWERRR
jgi:hypothetical protein